MTLDPSKEPSFEPSPHGSGFDNAAHLADNADAMAGDMRFFSLFAIVTGVFWSLTVVGAVIGIPMIIYHLKLNESALSYRRFVESGDLNVLNRAFRNQRKVYRFYKVLIIVSLLMFIGYVLLFWYLLSWGLMTMPQNIV